MISARYHKIKPTLNAKGADAFASTTDPALDIFTYTSKTFPSDLEHFTELVNKLTEVKNENSELFIKLLKFHRLIEKGNGTKNIYYTGMNILKLENPELYSQILMWSYQYPKDILYLCRTNTMFGLVPDEFATSTINYKSNQFHSTNRNSKGLKLNSLETKYKKSSLINQDISTIMVSSEIRIYGDLVIDTFKKILNNSKDYNPMLLKYMANESGHWSAETHLIWNYLESRLGTDDEFVQLVNSESVLDSELGNEFRNYLKNNKKNDVWFTNKNRRKIKKIFNKYVNLTDNLFKGIHSDGSLFNSHASKDTEIEMIYQVIKKTPTISLKNFSSTVNKFINSKKVQSARNELLIEGYKKYLQALKENKTKAKVHGLDISEKCMQFYLSTEESDVELEAQLQQLVNKLIEYMQGAFTEDFTYQNFADSIVPVIDISGSMDGVPINTGLYYFLMMTKVFKVKELYYFESAAHKVSLTEEDISGPICKLIKKIYKRVQGSTDLCSVFDLLDKESKENKIIMIITDGDCDPRGGTRNPFHVATNPGTFSHLHKNNYVVVNVKVDRLNFPFIDIDPKVCYLTGNNPKTINGLIKSLVVSSRDKIPITPSLILNYTLELDELDLPVVIPKFNKTLTEEQISKLYNIMCIKNQPPKPVTPGSGEQAELHNYVDEEEEEEEEDEDEDNESNYSDDSADSSAHDDHDKFDVYDAHDY